MSYADDLLAVIAAETSSDKALLLERIGPPSERASWTLDALPSRPGRAVGMTEAAEPPRRRRSLAHAPSRARFLHAIHHIELSAIDLATLLCLRASGAPADLHRDFLAIAREEAVHAGLLESWLNAHACPPGTFPIHHKLWDAALAARDLGEQLVVVPRYLEARGLDVSAELAPRLSAIDAEAGAIIERIYRDEIRHVAIGTRWHAWWCAEYRLDPCAHFADTVRWHFSGQLPSAFALDRAGRQQAGFSASELAVLEQPAPEGRRSGVPVESPAGG
ncbi:MAG: DUF455 family protein [Planctomycetes bacterium]|nr:DUF455 family protein [Planctomycetota bacterium]